MKKLSISMTKKVQFSGLIYLFADLFILPTLLVTGNSLLPTPLPEALVNSIYFALNFISVVLICNRFLWQSVRLALGKPWVVIKHVLWGFALYELSTYLVNLGIVFIMPDFANVNDQAIFAMSKDFFTLTAIGLVLLVPLVEETLYRGIVFRWLYDRSALLGYLLSTIVFASIHVISYLGAFSPQVLLLCFLQYIPAGLCLAWTYVKADNIFAPILVHMVINLIGVLTMR